MIESLLFERQRRIAMNGKKSEWLTIKADVPQGSILYIYIYVYIYIYLNDFSDNLESNVKLFPDDSSLFSVDK